MPNPDGEGKFMVKSALLGAIIGVILAAVLTAVTNCVICFEFLGAPVAAFPGMIVGLIVGDIIKHGMRR